MLWLCCAPLPLSDHRMKLARLLPVIATVAGAAALPVHAESFASSASSAASQSMGSSSTSLEGSSNSSTGNDKQAVNGRYQVQQVLAVAGEPGRVRLAMTSLDRAGETLTLELPAQTAEGAQVGTGSVVTATPRPYGVQFALATAAQPFFLVVDDAWMNELPSRPVTL